MLNKAHVIKITSTFSVGFMRGYIPWFFDLERGKKAEDGKNIFFKLLLINID